MIIFYSLMVADISSRIIFFISALSNAMNDSQLYEIDSASTMFSIMLGVSHSQNLCRLIIDLGAMQCKTQQEHEALAKKTIYVNIMLAVWLLFVLAFGLVLALDSTVAGVTTKIILFGLLGI